MPNSDIIGNLATAIMTKFGATTGGSNNSFYTAVNGRLFYGRAPEGAEYPYSIFMIPDHGTDRTFTEDYRDLLVQFNHYSDKPLDHTECGLVACYCEALFDCVSLTITGATMVGPMEMVSNPGPMPENVPVLPSGTTSGWVAVTEFEVKVSMA